MKTPEQMAEEYASEYVTDPGYILSKSGYLAGYQAAQQWISVKDRLPEDGEYVLIKCQDSEWYSIAFALREFWNKWNVTHWMPLPKPPEEK